MIVAREHRVSQEHRLDVAHPGLGVDKTRREHPAAPAGCRPLCVTSGVLGRYLCMAGRFTALSPWVRPRVAAVTLAVFLSAACASSAFAGSDVTVLVSRATGASGAVGSGLGPAVSDDGRIVSLGSFSSLDPDDTDNQSDVFVRDIQANTTVLASRATGGAKANGPSSGAISGDGRHVLLVSSAANLDPDDANGAQDVFVRDLIAGTTTLASRAAGVGTSAAGGAQASISRDGQRVAFRTTAPLDPSDTNAFNDVYVRDLATDATILVSRLSPGGPAVGDDFFDSPAISADGRFAAFSVNAMPDSANYMLPTTLYVRDLAAGTTSLVSRAAGPEGAPGNGGSREPAISADGRFVAFGTTATNLHPGDPSAGTDVLVRDMQSNLVTLVSRRAGPDGQKAANSFGDTPAISADGRFVAFWGNALHPDDNDAVIDEILLRDLQTNTLTLVNRASGVNGAKGNSSSLSPAISGDGQVVAWQSTSMNLHPDFTGPFGNFQVYARDPSPTPLPVVVPPPAPVPPLAAPPPPPQAPKARRPQPGCSIVGTVVVGTELADRRSGGSGSDVVFGLGGGDTLHGRAGRDCLYGDDGSDELYGDAGADRLFGGADGDVLHGGSGADRLDGQDGPDVLRDAHGRDRFSGGRGNDRIDARDATPGGRRIADVVRCGPGHRDVALADRRDRVARDCERVRRR